MKLYQHKTRVPQVSNWRKEADKKGQLFDEPVAHQGGGNTGLLIPGKYNHPKGKNPGYHLTIPTKGFKGAHFAVYPERLCELPIKAGSRPGDIVLDPFTGASTTGVVALKYGRKFIGIDLNEDYLKISEKRLKNTVCSLF